MRKNQIPPLPKTAENQPLLSLTALFEENFSIDWIVTLTSSKPSSVLSLLENLVDTGWLNRQKPGLYRFAKVQERLEVMKQFTPDEKKAAHIRIISLLLEEPLEDNEKAVHLYPHLLQINNEVAGCRWLKKAGDIFLKTYQTEQALVCYQKVINDLTSLQDEEADFLFIETAIRYSKVSMGGQETSKLISLLKTALKKTKNSSAHQAQEALLKMELAKNEWLRSRYPAALKYFQEGRSLAEKTKDDHIRQKTILFNIYFYFWQGRFKDIIQGYENFLPQITRFPKEKFQLRAVSLAAHAYAQAGQFNQALGMLDALQKYTEEIGDRHTQCYVVGNIGMIMLNMRKLDEAFHYHQRCKDLSRQAYNKWMTYSTTLSQAYFYYLMGDQEQAVSSLREFDQLRSKMQVFVSPVPSYFMELCWAIEQGKLLHKAEYSLQKEIQKAFRSENIFIKGLAYRYQGFLKEKEGASSEEIIQSFQLSVKWLEASGGLFEMAKTQLEMARRYLWLENVEKAREMVIMASKILSAPNGTLVPDEFKYLIDEKRSTGHIALDEILKLGQEIANIRDSRTLVLQIISTVNRITKAERGAIFLMEGEKLFLKASQNLTPSQISDPIFSFPMKVIEETARTGKGCIREINAQNSGHLPMSDGGIRSIICVPMILRGQVKGVLYHDNQFIPSAFKPLDQELLAYFAAQAAIALENVTSFEKIQLENQKLRLEKEYLEEQYRTRMHWGNIIGHSPAIKQVMDQIKKVAGTDSTVLVRGETGVGKELVANAIHQNSLRQDKPFIVVQCSALPENLIQSELFGHEKGAFTGAFKRRIGRLELANGGTFFMDEIGDLSLEVQVRLLRVLQTKRFERVGGNETLQSDFRLIVATNRDLEMAVKEGKFRADLFYRLNVFPIHVPPLRERKEDIPLLSQHFLVMHSKRLGKDFREINRETLAALAQYNWPGNIRELENTIERAMILNQPPVIKNIDLPLAPKGPHDFNPSGLDENGFTLEDNERRHIRWALQQTKGRISGPGGAAELLKINPSTLRFRIKKLGIPFQKPRTNG